MATLFRLCQRQSSERQEFRALRGLFKSQHNYIVVKCMTLLRMT